MKTRMMKKLLLVLLLTPFFMAQAGAEGVHLDKAHYDLNNQASLQRGAKIFTNYCLSCHSASAMRYNVLERIGLTAKQIKDNLMFTTKNIGKPMHVAMRPADGAKWFGVAPPDLSLIARARGADWLYTYLRTFYRDPSRPTGWNNLVFDKVAMPNVLYQLQGIQQLQKEEVTDASGNKHEVEKLVLVKTGKLSPDEYNREVSDLVNYLVYMGEPDKLLRMKIGVYVLLFLAFFLVVAYALKKEYWKDVH